MLRSWKVGRNNRVSRIEYRVPIRATRRTQREDGFLLFEVMVTVAILSLGLILILRSFTTSLAAARTSQDYMRACLLVEEKMWELEEEAETTRKVTTTPSKGEFMPTNEEDRWRENFSWEIATNDLRDEEGGEAPLDEVTVIVTWKEGGRKREVGLTTYLVNEEE